MHNKPDVTMLTSSQRHSKGGVISVELGPHVMDNIVVWFFFDRWEVLVRKRCKILINGECHRFDV